MKRNPGFSLIELLVVIAIIGILTTMAMSNFQSAQKRARDSQRKSDISQVKTALEMAKDDNPNGLYPNPDSSPAVTNFATLKTFLEAKGYMKVVPNDPLEGNTYGFMPYDGTDYTIFLCLENDSDPKKDAITTQYCNTPWQGRKMNSSMQFHSP